MARAIATVLLGPQQRHKTHIVSGEGNVVALWAEHILIRYLPEGYNPAHECWCLEHLPIVPEQWSMKINPRTGDLYTTIKRYLKLATLIVHAGDPGREGELVVEAVLEHMGVQNILVKRLLISDLNPPAVRRVQTPVQGLVVRRDREIEAFEPRAFYQVMATV